MTAPLKELPHETAPVRLISPEDPAWNLLHPDDRQTLENFHDAGFGIQLVMRGDE